MNNLIEDPAYAALRRDLRAKLDALLAEAEDPFIPDEWRELPLPERIRVENEFYALEGTPWRWAAYRNEVLEPYLEQNPSEQQLEELKAASEEIFDGSFFGPWYGLQRRIDRAADRNPERAELLRERQQEHATPYLERFDGRARHIMGAN
jgi:hypothetical protein